MNYIIWLIISGIFFAGAEFLSKKFALNPRFIYIIYIVLVDIFCVLTWLPAIMQKNQLSIVGTMWSVMSLLATILIGVIVFNETLTLTATIGIAFAFVSIILLSQV